MSPNPEEQRASMARLEKVGWELSNIDEFLEIEKRVR